MEASQFGIIVILLPLVLYFTVWRLWPQRPQTWLPGSGGAAAKESEWQPSVLSVHQRRCLHTASFVDACTRMIIHHTRFFPPAWLRGCVHCRWLTCTRWLQKCGRRGSQRAMQSTGVGQGKNRCTPLIHQCEAPQSSAKIVPFPLCTMSFL